MFDWICHNRDVFLMNYVEIGHSYKVAKELQEEHNHFTMSSMVNLLSDELTYIPHVSCKQDNNVIIFSLTFLEKIIKLTS